MEIGYKTSDNQIRKIVDMKTLREISESKSLQLPFVEIDIDEDKRWNARKINAEMLQAFEDGASIDDMAAKLMRVSDMNKNAAIRNARTMTTSFENLGRWYGMVGMRADGVLVKKQWLATNDGKTRDAHRELDGQTAEIDEPFKSMLGEIMFPGDPNAEPSNVYNCRCTLTYVVEGFGDPLFEEETYVYGDEKEAEKVRYKDSAKKQIKHKIKISGDETIQLNGKGLEYGGLDKNIDEETRNRIEHFENKYLYRGRGREHLMSLYDVTVNMETNAKEQVAKFTQGDEYSTEFVSGDVVTHIHPREAGHLGGTFSGADMRAFVDSGTKTMRAVAKEGTYSITKKSGFKGGELYADYAAEKVRLEKMRDEGKFSRYLNDFLAESHDWLLKNQKKYGYFYTLEMRGG